MPNEPTKPPSPGSEPSKREPLRSKISDRLKTTILGIVILSALGSLLCTGLIWTFQKIFGNVAEMTLDELSTFSKILPYALAAVFGFVSTYCLAKRFVRLAVKEKPALAPVPQPQPAPVPANSPYERRNDTNILELRKDFPVCEAAAKSAGLSPKLLRINNNRSRIFPDPKVPPTKMEKYEAFMNLLIDAIKGGIINPVAAMIPGLLDSYILKKEDITSFYKNHVPEINDAFFNPISNEPTKPPSPKPRPL